ncbi:UNVERIFIED_ORG: hypothetical protein ABID57_000851 [Arthrobacter sp. UYEF1]
MDPSSVWWANPKALAAFSAGKAAYFPMASPLSIPALDASAVKGKYKYALMPTLPAGETSNPSGGKPAASILSGDSRSSACCPPTRKPRRSSQPTK